MIEDIKIMLGEAATNYTDAQIRIAYKRALTEIEGYCNRSADAEMKAVACDIAIIKLNRINSEGLAAQSFSGVSESYIDGYPANIMAILNRKRKLKVM